MLSKELRHVNPPGARPPLIHIPDYRVTKFDGDPRAAFRVVHQITNHLDSEGLFWVLDVKHYPDPYVPAHMVTLESQHQSIAEMTHRRFLEDISRWERDMTNHHDKIEELKQRYNRHDQQQRLQNAIDRLVHPGPMPVYLPPVTGFSSTDASALNKTRETVRVHNSHASRVLSIIKTYLSERILLNCIPVLSNETQSPRNKARSLWEFIKEHRSNAPHAVQLVKRDISALDICHDYDDALRTLEAMNYLQSELYTMDAPYSDLDLITIHIGKLSSHERFLPLKSKYLTSDLSRSFDNQPNFNFLSSSPTVTTSNPMQHTWASYRHDITKYALSSTTEQTSSSALSAMQEPMDHYRQAMAAGYDRSQSFARNAKDYYDRNRGRPAHLKRPRYDPDCAPNDIATTHQLARDRRQVTQLISMDHRHRDPSGPAP